MDNDDLDGTLSTGLDPKLMLAATTLLIAASVGTWKVFQPTFAAGLHQRMRRLEQGTSASHQENDAAAAAAAAAAEKKKRSKERRKRAPVPKLPKSALALTAPAPGSPSSAKKVIRQPSALTARKSRPRSPSTSSTHHDEPISISISLDETPRPLSTIHYTMPSTSDSLSIQAENIPLPPSPVLGRSSSPAPQPTSPSASTSASTSGAPLTPPSLAVSQLSLPALATDSPSWQWDDKQAHDASPVPQRGRKRPPRRNKSPAPSPLAATFPTLNTLPPPNTPLEVQVEFMRNQVETYRAQDQANRAREEALLIDVERLRVDAEHSRQDVSRLQWQLSDMTQREERLISQLNALTMQVQAMHQSRPGQPLPSGPIPVGIPVPLYQPQPIPYPSSQGHLGFYHHPHAAYPYATGSPMHAPPTPTSLLSPTHIHPLMTSSMPGPHPQSGTPTSPLAIESFRGGGSRGSMPADDGSNGSQTEEISFGLMEAIFKRPESYAASQGSQRGSGSVRSTRSPSESLSPTGSSAGLRSIHTSRSPSVCAESSLEPEGIPVPIPSISSMVMSSEYTAKPVLDSQDSVEIAGETSETQESCEDDQHTPGQDIPAVLHSQPPSNESNTCADEARSSSLAEHSQVQVYY